MVNITVNSPKILLTFLFKFRPCFSKPVFNSFVLYISGLFLSHKRLSVQVISSSSLFTSYEKMQYFLSQADWNPDDLNSHRINILQANRTTKSSKNGVLVIDDSGSKKWGFSTEGAQIQYFGTEKTTTNCNVVVASAYCDPSKRFPINFKPYIPENNFFFSKHQDSVFKSKHKLALELVQDAIDNNISFSDILFDSWYFSSDFALELDDSNLTFISEAPVDRLISFKGKWLHAGELVKFIPRDKFHAVTVTTPKKKSITFMAYSFTTKVKGIDALLRIVVSIGKWDKSDPKRVHVFVTNHLAYSSAQVIAKYTLRWGIECIFRDLKENVYFDHFQVRSINAIARHWTLASLAYSFLYWSKQNGYLSKNYAIGNIKPKTLGEQLSLFRKICSLNAVLWINRNQSLYQNFLGIKYCSRQAA